MGYTQHKHGNSKSKSQFFKRSNIKASILIGLNKGDDRMCHYFDFFNDLKYIFTEA